MKIVALQEQIALSRPRRQASTEQGATMPPKHFGLDRDAMGMGELGSLLGGMALPKGRSKGRISLCELFDLMQGMFRIAGCVA